MWKNIQKTKLAQLALMKVNHPFSQEQLTLYGNWFEKRKMVFPKGQMRRCDEIVRDFAYQEIGELTKIAVGYLFCENDWEAAQEVLHIGHDVFLEHGHKRVHRQHGCICDDAEDFIFILNELGLPHLAENVFSRGVWCRGQRTQLHEDKGPKDVSCSDIHKFILWSIKDTLRACIK